MMNTQDVGSSSLLQECDNLKNLNSTVRTERKYLKRSVDLTTPVTAAASSKRLRSETPVATPTTKPSQDRDAFYKRLETFSSAYVGRARPVSAVECAMHGFVDTHIVEKKHNICKLSCTSCNCSNFVVDVTGYERDIPKTMRRLRDQYVNDLTKLHCSDCFWKYDKCADDIYAFPIQTSTEALDLVKTEGSRLMSFPGRLPTVQHPLTSEQLRKLDMVVRGTEHFTEFQPTLQDMPDSERTPYIYALFGWRLSLEDFPSLKCHQCFKWVPNSANPQFDVVNEHMEYCPWVNRDQAMVRRPTGNLGFVPGYEWMVAIVEQEYSFLFYMREKSEAYQEARLNYIKAYRRQIQEDHAMLERDFPDSPDNLPDETVSTPQAEVVAEDDTQMHKEQHLTETAQELSEEPISMATPVESLVATPVAEAILREESSPVEGNEEISKGYFSMEVAEASAEPSRAESSEEVSKKMTEATEEATQVSPTIESTGVSKEASVMEPMEDISTEQVSKVPVVVEPTEAASEESAVDEPAEKVSEEPVEEVSDEIVEEVSEELAEKVSDEPVEEVSDEPVEEVSEKPVVVEPVDEAPKVQVFVERTEDVSDEPDVTEPTEEVSEEPTITEPTEEVYEEPTVIKPAKELSEESTTIASTEKISGEPTIIEPVEESSEESIESIKEQTIIETVEEVPKTPSATEEDVDKELSALEGETGDEILEEEQELEGAEATDVQSKEAENEAALVSTPTITITTADDQTKKETELDHLDDELIDYMESEIEHDASPSAIPEAKVDEAPEEIDESILEEVETPADVEGEILASKSHDQRDEEIEDLGEDEAESTVPPISPADSDARSVPDTDDNLAADPLVAEEHEIPGTVSVSSIQQQHEEEHESQYKDESDALDELEESPHEAQDKDEENAQLETPTATESTEDDGVVAAQTASATEVDTTESTNDDGAAVQISVAATEQNDNDNTGAAVDMNVDDHPIVEVPSSEKSEAPSFERAETPQLSTTAPSQLPLVEDGLEGQRTLVEQSVVGYENEVEMEGEGIVDGGGDVDMEGDGYEEGSESGSMVGVEEDAQAVPGDEDINMETR